MNLLSIKEVASLTESGCFVLDTRTAKDFALGFIPYSTSVPFGDSFTELLDLVLTADSKVIIVAESGKEIQVEKHLLKIGFLNIAGFVDGGFEKWKEQNLPIDIVIDVPADEFAIDYHFDEFYLIDIRPEDQYMKEHIEHAENLPLSDLEQNIADLDANMSIYLYGNSFEDSCFAASLFRKYDFSKVRFVSDGYETIKQQDKISVTKEKKKRADKESADFSAN